MRYNLFVLGIISVVILFSGCQLMNKNSEISREGIRVGVIQTKTQKKSTQMKIYDENCKMVESKRYRVNGVGRYGIGSPQSRDGIVYDIAIGNDYEKDLGLVIGFDLYKNEIKKYHFDRVNLVDLYVTNQYIYTISNLNGKTYFDRYNFFDKQVESYCWEKEMLGDFTVSAHNEIFFANPDGILYSLQMETGTVKKIGNVAKYCGEGAVISHMHVVKDKLYISFLTSSDILVVEPSDNEMHLIELNLESGGQILDDGNYIYVASANSLDDGCIIKMKIDTEEVAHTWNFDYDIYYFDIYRDFLFTLSYNESKLRTYFMTDDKVDLKNDTVISGEGYILSGIAVSEG